MKSVVNKFNLRIFVSIFILCLVWIVGTDTLVYFFKFSPDQMLLVNIAKGILFIFFVSLYVAFAYERERHFLLQKEYDDSRFFIQSPEPMLICSIPDLKIREYNLVSDQYLGLGESGQADLFLPQFFYSPELLLKNINENQHKEIIDGGVHQILHPSKTDIFARVSVFIVNFRNEACYLIKLNDQTDLVEAQEMASLNSKLITLGELSANIAHEVKNPLTIISLALSKLRDKLLRNKLQVDEIEMIESSICRIEATVTCLQRISRNEFHDKKEKLQLSRMINDSLILIRDKFIQNNIEVTVSVDEEAFVFGHETEITQVLVNLLKNAVDSMESRKNKNWILISSLKKGDRWQLRIMDSGHPIPSDIQHKIFNRFFTTKAPGKGTGLGLSFSKRIIERHDGSITLDVNSPHTTFVIELPSMILHEANLEH